MTSETCEICGQEGFVGEAEVRTHMLLDHEENSGSCPLCDLAHVSVEELAYHMNTAHRHVLSPAYAAKLSSSSYRTESHAHDTRDDDVVVAEEVQEVNSLIYIEDYFAEPSGIKLQNGDGKDIHKASIDDADVARENGNATDVNQNMSDREEGSHLRQSMDVNGSSHDLFDESSVSAGRGERGYENGQEEPETECMIIDESKEGFKERKIISLEAGRTGPGEETPQDQKQNDRKRGRKEPDVRPKDTRQSQILQSAERRTSHQSLDTQASSRSGNESVASETSSPFRKLFRTLTGRTAETNVEDRKEQSGIWVDLSNDSEPDLLDDDSFEFIEDALPAEEIQWEDIPSTSSDVNPYSTSTPTKAKSKSAEDAKAKTQNPDKPTLLSLSQSSKNVQSPILCPICGLGSYDPDFLYSHINAEHPEGAVGGTGTGNKPHDNGAMGDGDITCPVCGLVGLGTNEMNAHVEGHFVEGPSAGDDGASTSRSGQTEMTDMDRRLAEQLAEDERRERERKEEEEFKKLQVL